MGLNREIANQSRASQGKYELLWLLEKLQMINPKVILEIGVHQGYSIEVWKRAFKPALTIGIETDIHALDYKDFVLINLDSHSPKALRRVGVLLSHNKYLKLDFLFIDGDHTYEGVKKDFEMYSPLVRKGGIIAFDDAGITDNPTVEVYKFWDELRNSGQYKTEFWWADSNGIGIVHV